MDSTRTTPGRPSRASRSEAGRGSTPLRRSWRPRPICRPGHRPSRTSATTRKSQATLAPEGDKHLQAANLYGSWRKGYKPAAPNLAEAEAAEILEPERTWSWEVGLKARAFEELSFDASYFDMRFENLVVSTLGAGGGPELTNAGAERFRGFETQLRWTARALPGLGLDAGYAHHDARYQDFSFVTPDSQLVDVGGHRVELTPRDLVNARASFHSRRGPGAFVAIRWQGARPLNRRNTFFTGAYAEWDAGLSYERGPWSASLVGHNLADDRHVTTESEIGDSQFYVAPQRRISAEFGISY